MRPRGRGRTGRVVVRGRRWSHRYSANASTRPVRLIAARREHRYSSRYRRVSAIGVGLGNELSATPRPGSGLAAEDDGHRSLSIHPRSRQAGRLRTAGAAPAAARSRPHWSCLQAGWKAGRSLPGRAADGVDGRGHRPSHSVEVDVGGPGPSYPSCASGIRNFLASTESAPVVKSLHFWH